MVGCLISTRSRDGASTLFTRTDLNKLAHQNTKPQVVKLEEEFVTAELMARNLVSTGAINVDKALDSNMLYRVRSVTHLLGKTQETLLGEEWNSLEEITAKLYDDLGATKRREFRNTEGDGIAYPRSVRRRPSQGAPKWIQRRSACTRPRGNAGLDVGNQ